MNILRKAMDKAIDYRNRFFYGFKKESCRARLIIEIYDEYDQLILTITKDVPEK